MTNELLIPPHSIDSEQAVLGGLMMCNQAFDSCDFLVETDFYRHDHLLIYRQIAKLIQANKQADAVTVSENLDTIGALSKIGGFAYVGSLAKSAPSVVNIVAYAEIVRDKRIARDLITVAGKVHDLAFGQAEISERVDTAQSLLLSLSDTENSSSVVHIQETLKLFMQELDERCSDQKGKAGLSTGLIDLDEMIGGLQNGHMIVIAGCTSMGKSALAMQIATSVAETKPVLIFSLEMRGLALAERMVANLSKTNSRFLRDGRLEKEDWGKLSSAIGKLRERNIYTDQSCMLSMNEIRSRARRHKRENGLGLIVIDYMQLMHGEGQSREQQVASISRGIKLLATELNVPVIAISQLSRKPNERMDKRPMLSDLRESGSIEQDADIVMFVYRHEYYEPNVAKGIAEVLIRKNRMGNVGDVYLSWFGEFCRFENHAGHYQPPIAKSTKNGFDG